MGDTHITGRHFGGDTHITSDMCAGIHISRGYTYHCDAAVGWEGGYPVEPISRLWLLLYNDRQTCQRF